MTVDSNDLNQDGKVTQDEIDTITQPLKPKPSFLQAVLGAIPGVSVPVALARTADMNKWAKARGDLQAQYGVSDTPTAVDDAIASTASMDAVAQFLEDVGAAEKETSGYLGVDDLVAAKAVAQEVGADGVTRYFVDTKDGAREVLYKDGDPYKALTSLGPKDLLQWRKTMWLGGYLEPKSFVGAVTMDDITAMQTAMTEANMTGVQWQDAIAARVEQGARYGRPITEAEIMALDDDVPGLIQEYAARNGVEVSPEFIARQQRRVLSGKETPESVLDNLRDVYVKPLYPQFEAELDKGMTLQDIAAPYISKAASMLEIPETEIDLNDPTIKRVLSARDQGGAPMRKSLWEFEDELTQDPRWKFTDNAYSSYESAVNGMLSEMGI